MTIFISSKDNEKVKNTKALLKSKNRAKESKFIIEGFRILTQAIECNADLQYVFINEDFENKNEHVEFLKVLESKNIKIHRVAFAARCILFVGFWQKGRKVCGGAAGQTPLL